MSHQFRGPLRRCDLVIPTIGQPAADGDNHPGPTRLRSPPRRAEHEQHLMPSAVGVWKAHVCMVVEGRSARDAPAEPTP